MKLPIGTLTLSFFTIQTTAKPYKDQSSFAGLFQNTNFGSKNGDTQPHPFSGDLSALNSFLWGTTVEPISYQHDEDSEHRSNNRNNIFIDNMNMEAPAPIDNSVDFSLFQNNVNHHDQLLSSASNSNFYNHNDKEIEQLENLNKKKQNKKEVKDLFAFMDNNLFKEIDPASSLSTHQSSVMSPVITDEEEEEMQVPLTMNFTSK